MTARWWAFGLWAAVAASAVYWGLKLFVPGVPAPAHAVVAATAASPRGDLTRLLGADPVAPVAAAPPPSARFQLIGVVAPRSSAANREGLALIAVDGKPPRAYRVGAVIEGDLVLKTVGQRGASLGPRDGAASVALDIPPPMPAATGTLPPAGQPAPPAPTMRPPLGARPLAAPGALPQGMARPPQQAPNPGQMPNRPEAAQTE